MRPLLYSSLLFSAACLLLLRCQNARPETHSQPVETVQSPQQKPTPGGAVTPAETGSSSPVRTAAPAGEAGTAPGAVKGNSQGHAPAAIEHGSPEQAKLDSLKAAKTKGKK